MVAMPSAGVLRTNIWPLNNDGDMYGNCVCGILGILYLLNKNPHLALNKLPAHYPCQPTQKWQCVCRLHVVAFSYVDTHTKHINRRQFSLELSVIPIWDRTQTLHLKTYFPARNAKNVNKTNEQFLKKRFVFHFNFAKRGVVLCFSGWLLEILIHNKALQAQRLWVNRYVVEKP